ncbi:MAG: hypothetical protein R3B47_18275 [Bacteroidia bacterium]
MYDPAAGNIKSYLNGVLNSTVGQSTLNISGTGFRLSSGGTGLGAGETMDEFRVYGRALNARELWLPTTLSFRWYLPPMKPAYVDLSPRPCHHAASVQAR